MYEPKINVGIMARKELRVTFEGVFRVGAEKFCGSHVIRCDAGKLMWGGVAYESLLFEPVDDGASFELDDVTIGVGFHWERKECQRFAGALKVIPDVDAGCCVAVNVIGVEEYLRSVISSEMSASASQALLRAHAVVSRSWLLRQLADRGKHTCAEAEEWRSTAVGDAVFDELIKWYDREDHTLFDVCADDHCQRYQGVTRQTTPAVAEAVDATRGMVLTYGGEVCDARFSKCCGGVSETFENCWENASHPYLESVKDCDAAGHCFCDTDDRSVLDTVLNNYDRETLDFFKWEVRYGADDLSELVRRRSGIDFGRIHDLVPLTRGKSGRIVRLLVKGERRSLIVGKELEIRRWLSDTHLRSSAFDVTRSADGDFIFRGRGWGHGVGLCQIGAAVMGASGYGFREILNHYFPKAGITALYCEKE